MRTGIRIVLFCSTLMFQGLHAAAWWHPLLQDSFDGSSSGLWAYVGVSNANHEPLIQYDSVDGCVRAEWHQTNEVCGACDPFVITPSFFSRPLEYALRDRDTFRIHVTLNLSTGTVANTLEFYQIACFGVYSLLHTGPDRAMSDNYSGNTTLMKDACDFVDFCYFINNSWGGPNITAVIGAHIDGLNGAYTTGIDWLQTAMGEDHWLPEGTNLYMELVYYGAATGELARTAHTKIYTEPERTNVLVVNDVEMSYDTEALPIDQHFRVTEFAFLNYVAEPYDAASILGSGAGAFDDVLVEHLVDEGQVFGSKQSGTDVVTEWAVVSGETYYVQSCTDLVSGVWTTSAIVTAESGTLAFTGSVENTRGWYRVSR